MGGESANRLKAAPVFSVCVRRKKSGDDLDVGVHRNARGGQVLRPAIDEDDKQSDEEMGEACASRRHSSLRRFLGVPSRLSFAAFAVKCFFTGRTQEPLTRSSLRKTYGRLRKTYELPSNSFSTALQRSQTVGYVLSSPTCVE